MVASSTTPFTGVTVLRTPSGSRRELRSLPKRVCPIAQDYGTGLLRWLASSCPTSSRPVWFVQEYGSGRTSSLSPHAVAVSPTAELPKESEDLRVMEDLAFSPHMLGARQDDPYYLVYPEECLEGAVNVALLRPGPAGRGLPHGCFRRRDRQLG